MLDPVAAEAVVLAGLPSTGQASVAASTAGASRVESADAAPAEAQQVDPQQSTQLQLQITDALKPLMERLAKLEGAAAGRQARTGGDGTDPARPLDEASVSDGASSVSGIGDFAPVSGSNPHLYGAGRNLVGCGDYAPRRYSLHGDRTQAVLDAGPQEHGGTLGLAYSYAPCAATFQAAGLSLLERTLETVDPSSEQYEALEACLNTFAGVYDMVNELRQLLVEKTDAVRPGASEYEKARAKFIIRTFAARDTPSDDVPYEIKKLKKAFSASAERADMYQVVRRQHARDGSRRGSGSSRDGSRRDGSRRDGSRRDGSRRDSSDPASGAHMRLTQDRSARKRRHDGGTTARGRGLGRGALARATPLQGSRFGELNTTRSGKRGDARGRGGRADGDRHERPSRDGSELSSTASSSRSALSQSSESGSASESEASR